MEMFKSCLIVPIPLLTFAALRISPILSAASLICSGDFKSGFVVISTSGIPSRSNLKVDWSSSWLMILAASSSSAIVSMPTFPSEVSMWPSWAMRTVRWNPEVFEPSTTVFRMIWVTGKILQLKRRAIWIAMSRAWGLIWWGGSSSSSTKQFVS